MAAPLLAVTHAAGNLRTPRGGRAPGRTLKVKAAPYAGLRLTDVVGALSFALDLAEGQPIGHSVRTTMIGMRIADTLGLSDAERSTVFYTLLLKDLGSSSNAARTATLFGGDDRIVKQAHKVIDWSDRLALGRHVYRNAPSDTRSGLLWRSASFAARAGGIRMEMVQTRSNRGREIAETLALPPGTAEAIASIDERWDGSGMPHGMVGDSIPLASRIAALAQSAEIHSHSRDVDAAWEVARRRAGGWFDPELVRCLGQFRDDASFWGRLPGADSLSALGDFEPPERIVYADELRIDTVAEAFAKVIDAKSPYTARHSHNVAFLASRTAREMGMPRHEVRALRRAALLHDVGKLAVSSAILDKRTKLTAGETAAMRGHVTHTFDILNRVSRFQRFARIAASHHERLDGKGYVLGLTGESLNPMARVLAVSDVCEALTADRPYRAGLPLDEALAELKAMVDGGQLCGTAVEALAGWFRGGVTTTGSFAAEQDSTSLVG